MMNFLASMLREEGGFDYKRSIVNTIIIIIEENPEAKESGLTHLCEFIEDCDYIPLATKILHLLGREGPRTTTPAKYIRYIYNRVILESAEVRAAAVSALAKFGASSEDLLPSILILLQRSMFDEDDEVRDRATFYFNVLSQQDKTTVSAYILNALSLSLVSLERALQQYTLEPSEKPFDIKTVPIDLPVEQSSVKSKDQPSLQISSNIKSERPAASKQDIYAEQLSAIPEFAHLGPLFKSSQSIELTEAETEYSVKCTKHMFTNYIVFQFDCVNTLNDQLLEKVCVKMETSDGFEVVSYKSCAKLAYNSPGSTYTLCKLPDDPSQGFFKNFSTNDFLNNFCIFISLVTGTFNCVLKFVVKDCDPNTGIPDNEDGYQDEYVLENIEVNVADHVSRVLKANFGASWEEVGGENELEDTYALAMPSLEGLFLFHKIYINYTVICF